MTVFLDKNIYAPAGGYLAEHAEVVTDFEHPEKLAAIICRARPITRELIEQCPNLKVIARHSVGVDSVDVECATQRRIAVINAPTSNADSVAELVVALFLMLSRMLYEANVKSRESSFEKKAPANFRGLEMNGKVFGQIGMGNIAQRVARIMHNGFGCKVLGYDPFISAEDAAARGFEKVDSIEQLLEMSDYVNVNVPLIPGTKNMLGREVMAHFKQGTIFVNAARGGVADEDALYDCMVSGQLRGAACDTFADGEPVSPDHNLLTLRNFSATPHLGGNTEEVLQKTGMQIVKDTLAYLNGEGGYHQVNKF